MDEKKPVFPMLFSGTGLPDPVEGFINHMNNLRSVAPERAQDELVSIIEEGLRRGGRVTAFFQELDKQLVALGKIPSRSERRVQMREKFIEENTVEEEESW